jgi:hypothetical protein
MGYKVLPDVCKEYGPRKGLEGPFNFMGRVLYYDPQEGRYWDPRTDFYLEHDEFQELNMAFMRFMAAI